MEWVFDYAFKSPPNTIHTFFTQPQLFVMAYQFILVETPAPGIAKITLNRPDALNALSPALVQELKQATEAIAADSNLKVMIVTGADRAFSAGVDLKALNESIQGGKFSADQILIDGASFIDTMQQMPQVTIAMVNGFCYTGATEFMLAFDLIVAAEEAQIGDTHAKWGIAPKWGMTQRLQQKVGLLKAMEMSFTAKPVSGKEAERIGLVNRAVPLADLETHTLQLAQDILANSAQTIAAMKQFYYFGANHTISQGLEKEYQTQVSINDREAFLRDFEKNKKK